MPDYFSESEIVHAAIKISCCENCKKNCIWMFDEYIYPNTNGAPRPNSDMPEDVKIDYIEAAEIYTQSPRGAAALLRLAIQKLMVSLGELGENINHDIASLVKKGLPTLIQQALDVVRVTGNSAVHPGQLDTNDEQIALQLFPLVNLIVEYQISLPARVNNLYSTLPANLLAGIDKRDS
jgi:hypothetical protein